MSVEVEQLLAHELLVTRKRFVVADADGEQEVYVLRVPILQQQLHEMLDVGALERAQEPPVAQIHLLERHVARQPFAQVRPDQGQVCKEFPRVAAVALDHLHDTRIRILAVSFNYSQEPARAHV